MTEWLIVHAWKACVPKGTGGSNPPPSATQEESKVLPVSSYAGADNGARGFESAPERRSEHKGIKGSRRAKSLDCHALDEKSLVIVIHATRQNIRLLEYLFTYKRRQFAGSGPVGS